MTIPKKVGVIGGGRMGAGIAHAFLINGTAVTVIERDADAANSASDRVLENVAKSITRGMNIDQNQLQFEVSVDRSDLAACDLVIEAVPEDIGLKLETLISAERYLGENAVLASNTSSISIDDLARDLQHPERFLGLHFFNPVPASQLIEVVAGAQTDQKWVESAAEWTRDLGKTPVVVKDSPGFASSRLGNLLAVEAIRMVEEGVASAEDIDNAMVLGYKHASGPLRTTDLVGLDVRLGIMEYLSEHLGERFAPPQILRDKVAAGELGKKTGKGFYDWSN